MRRLVWAACVVVVLAAAGFGGWLVALGRFEAPGPLPVLTAVVVPRGAPGALAEALEAGGVISGTLPFRAAAYLTSGAGPLRAGEFAFPAHASLSAVLGILRAGRAVQHRLTIPEGLTAAQIATLLDRAPALDGETPMPNEGGVLPETYAYTHGTYRGALLSRAEAGMESAVEQIWAARDPAIPLGSAQDLVTLASIVERETSHPDERPHIAAVFLNRLRLGMKLQSDPTTAYAVSGGMTTNDRGLTRADLEAPNPYNTYFAPGLPPGPIVSPGIAAMQAVAHPLASDDLYFVAEGGGGHAFARTLEEHNANVARWRALRARP